MYSDEQEESFNEEIIEIMMQDQKSSQELAIEVSTPVQRPPTNGKITFQDHTGNKKTDTAQLATVATIPLPSPVEFEIGRKTPSPRHSPCPSPGPFMPHNNGVSGFHDPAILPPATGTVAKDQMMDNHLHHPVPHKHNLSTINTRSIGGCKDKEGGNEVEGEDSCKETGKNKMGDGAKKSGSSTMSRLEMTSFQQRLFGFHHGAAHKRKCHTLPASSKVTSSKRIDDVQLLTEPILSPATITDSPFPPPEPKELKYIEVIYYIVK